MEEKEEEELSSALLPLSLFLSLPLFLPEINSQTNGNNILRSLSNCHLCFDPPERPPERWEKKILGRRARKGENEEEEKRNREMGETREREGQELVLKEQ